MKIKIIICIVLMLMVTSVIDSFNHNKTDTPEKADVIVAGIRVAWKKQRSCIMKVMRTMSLLRQRINTSTHRVQNLL